MEKTPKPIYILQTYLYQPDTNRKEFALEPVTLSREYIAEDPAAVEILDKFKLIQLPMGNLVPCRDSRDGWMPSVIDLAFFCYSSLDDVKRLALCRCGKPTCSANTAIIRMVDQMQASGKDEVCFSDVIS